MELKKAPPPVSEINVTPMVDVMLVVLIIFMVITPLLSKTVPLDMAKAGTPPPWAMRIRKMPSSSPSPAMGKLI